MSHSLFIGMNNALLVSLSTITYRVSFPNVVLSKPKLNYMEMSSHFHTGIFKGWNKYCRPLMLTLDFLTCQTPWNKLKNIPFHPKLPKRLLQVLIHFISSRMNKVLWTMSLYQDFILELCASRRYTPSTLVSDATILEYRESFSFPFFNMLFYFLQKGLTYLIC